MSEEQFPVWRRRLKVTFTAYAEVDGHELLAPKITLGLKLALSERAVQQGIGDSGYEYTYAIDGVNVTVRRQFENQYWENGVLLRSDE